MKRTGCLKKKSTNERHSGTNVKTKTFYFVYRRVGMRLMNKLEY